jgi:hypothetical protein
MIRGAEVLLAVAQIAIGLAGFSGVVAAFSRSREFHVEDRVRFLMLICGTFAVILLAFVPLLLDLGGLDESQVWRWSSGAWLLTMGSSLPLLSWGRSVIVRRGRPAPGWSVLLVLLVTAGAAAAQAGNVIAWPYAPGPVPFILGLMAGLLGSGTIFVYLVLITHSPGELGAEEKAYATSEIVGL